MELGPEDVSLLERCTHFRGCYVKASMEVEPEDVSLIGTHLQVLYILVTPKLLFCRRQVSQALSALVPTLNTQLYNQNVENAAKGSIVVLFLTNNVDKESLLRLFPKLIGKYIINRHIKFFRGSFETKRAWLEELLRECNMDPQELERRRCVYDELRIEQHFPVVCTLALFGAKKQFSIFPEMGSGHSRLNGLSTSEPVASAANQNASKEENSRNTGVMDTVMNSFGFEDGKTSDSRGFNSALSLWMERLEDGSLRRYSINHWPQWHQ